MTYSRRYSNGRLVPREVQNMSGLVKGQILYILNLSLTQFLKKDEHVNKFTELSIFNFIYNHCILELFG